MQFFSEYTKRSSLYSAEVDVAFAEVKSIFLLILGQFLKHNRSTEDIILIFDFEDALVKLDKMGYRLKSEPLAGRCGGYEATVFRLGKLAGVVVRRLPCLEP